MANLPEPIQAVIDAFARLPGIGPKTASRLAFHLLRAPETTAGELAEALTSLHSATATCPECFNIMAGGRQRCEICEDAARMAELLCVVEEPLDVFALERAGGVRGRYHVLHGVLSPIEGVTAEDLRIRELVERVREGGVQEVILATNPSLEGDATAIYIQRQLQSLGVRVTRLARGLPVGGDLEYADQGTLKRALEGRQSMD